MAQAYAQQVTDGMDGYVVGDPDGGAGIYTGNPNECWHDTDGDGVPDMYCLIDTGDTAWMLTASSLVLFMTPGVMNKTIDDATIIQAVSPVSIRQYMSGTPSSSVSCQHSLGLPV